uniref:Uncharacterized protein n=1 Tax=Corethron hystrix TaxID=216773 RepID=A0A7S1FR65_9STRA
MSQVSSRFSYLVVGVINFSEEISIFIGIPILFQPKGKNSPMNNKKNSKETSIVNSEPFVGSFGGNSGRGSQNSGNTSNNSGGGLLSEVALHSHANGRAHKSYETIGE